MATDLKLQVKLGLIDKALGPLKRLREGSSELGTALKASRDELAKLRKIDNFQKQQQALGGTAEKLNQAQARVRELREQMNALGSEASSKLRKDFTKANQAVGDLTKMVQAQRTELGQHRERLKTAGIGTAELRTSQASLKTQMAQANTAIDQQKEKLKQLQDVQARRSQLKADHGKSMMHAGMLGGAGYAGMAVGRRALSDMGSLLGEGMTFDTTMSKVQALSGLDKNSEQYQALRAQARELGASTMFSATDAARGQAFLAMAGFTPESIQAAMPGLLDMAKAGDMDLGRTADIASNILSGFKIDPSHMGNVADVLTKAFTTSNVSIEMLGETMKYVGPVATTAGMGLEEAAAMAGLLGNVGIQSSQAGTTLRAMLLRLAAPAGPAAKAMEKLGISSKDAQGNVRGITEVLGEVAEATEKMGSGDRLEYFKQIFGEEPAAGMAELIQQAGAGGILKYLDVVKDHAGAAGKTAKTMADNLEGDLDELFSGLAEVRIELFDQQNGALRELVQTFTALVNQAGAWVRENPKLTSALVKGAAGIAALVAVGGTLLITLASIMAPISLIKFGFGMLGTTSFGLAAAFAKTGTLIGTAVRGISIALWGLAANPVFLTIAAAVAVVAGAAYLIYRNWDRIGPYFQALWSWVTDVFRNGTAQIFGFFKAAFSQITGFFTALPSKFTEFGGNIIQGLINGITGSLGAVKTAITGAGKKAIGWFKETLGIRSPSRVFAGLGGDTMAGLEQGLAGGESGALKQLAGTAKRLTAAGAVGLGLAGGTPAFAGMPPIDSRPPLAAASSSGTGGITIGGDTITIIVQGGPGQDVAQQIKRALEEHERNKLTRARSALYDQE